MWRCGTIISSNSFSVPLSLSYTSGTRHIYMDAYGRKLTCCLKSSIPERALITSTGKNITTSNCQGVREMLSPPTTRNAVNMPGWDFFYCRREENRFGWRASNLHYDGGLIPPASNWFGHGMWGTSSQGNMRDFLWEAWWESLPHYKKNIYEEIVPFYFLELCHVGMWRLELGIYLVIMRGAGCG